MFASLNFRRCALFGLLCSTVSVIYSANVEARPDAGCTNGVFDVDELLPTGARWQMCFETREAEGVVLSDVYYSPPGTPARKVLGEASLAQARVAYDDGEVSHDHLVESGFGGDNLRTLAAADCPNGTLMTEGAREVICRQVQGRGYLYKYYTDQRQGYWLSLLSKSTVGDMTYLVRWRFFDDGTVEPSIGMSGRLEQYGADSRYGWPIDADGTTGVSFSSNYYWRLDFDIGSNPADDLVEELQASPANLRTRKSLSVNAVRVESARAVNAENKRSWRVRDTVETNGQAGSFVSYHLEPLNTAHRYQDASEPWSFNDFFVTRFNGCERLASGNTGACGENLGEYLNGESTDTDDVVLWYRVSYHHLPRGEDESIIPTRWVGFQIVPRDWTRTNPFASLELLFERTRGGGADAGVRS